MEYGFHDWLKSPRFIVIGWDSSIKKRVVYLSCIELKGSLKDIHCTAQNAPLYVDLYKTSFRIVKNTKKITTCFMAKKGLCQMYYVKARNLSTTLLIIGYKNGQ